MASFFPGLHSGLNMSRKTSILLLLFAGLLLAPNTAARQFKKPVYYDAGSGPWSVVSADFNRDGNVDLAVSDLVTSEVKVLLGNGKGGFRFGGKFSVPGASAMAVGDFNGDHIPDLAVVESGGTGQSSLAMFMGNGDGSFRNSGIYALGIEAGFLAVADLNGDGSQDIAVTNSDYADNGKYGNLMIFFGRGDGTLKKPVTYNLPNSPTGVAAGDLYKDHRADLAVAELNNSSLVILTNDGRGKFKQTATYSLGQALEPASVVISHLVHGGNADVVVTDVGGGISVLLGNGDGTFGNPTFYSTAGVGGFGPAASVIADFNRDGKLDIATVLHQKNSALFYGNGDGTFQLPIPLKLIDGGPSMVTGNFNKDGSPDLAVIVQTADQIAILLNAE